MRKGGFTVEVTGLFERISDWARSGLQFKRYRSGRAADMMICDEPAIGTFAELDARTDIKTINGAQAVMIDIGTWGSNWVVLDGVWVPDGPIAGLGSPEGVITAPAGTLYERTDGVEGQRAYTKWTGSGNTGWVADQLDSSVMVHPWDLAATIKSKIETVNPDAGSSGGTPWSEGVGRMVRLPGKKLVTGFLTISQAQSLSGIKGSGHLALDPTAVGVDPGDGTTGYVTIANDFRSHSGIAGQGLWENLDIDASGSQGMATPTRIHGLYAPERAGSANVPTLFNVSVYGAKNDGIHLLGGNDKLVFYRMRQEGSLERGVYVAGSDLKGSDLGTVSQGTALEVDSAAVEINKFDVWRSANPTSAPTLKITGASNGCVFNSGTIEGDTLFIGKNGSNTNRGINSKAQFIATHFKLKAGFTGRTSLFKAQGADLVEFIACKWGQTGNSNLITPYDYLIEITNAGGDDIDGLVKIIGGSGMLRMLGRVGATNRQKIDCLKHVINKPQRLLFEWGRMGTVEFVPAWVCDASDPTLFTHLACDGRVVNVIDQPFGYLNWAAHNGNWSALLDDAVATFQMPDYPAISSNCVPAIRAIP